MFSPSSAVRDKASVRRAVARLKAMGHEVELDEAALVSHLRFAGDDDTRLAGIARAAASGADVALISRGGYGLTRLLPRLPYKAIAKAIDRGTEFVGLSDFTAFQNAVLAKTGHVTWAGPALGADLGTVEEPDDIMLACFDDLLCGQGEGAGWQLPRPRKSAAAGVAGVAGEGATAPAATAAVPAGLEVRKATLWGGNLSVLVSMVGTPFLPEVRGGVLFLEDVNEHPYRIERMLTQLLHAGILARQKAIVLGQFTDYKLSSHDRGYKFDTVVQWLRAQVKAPVLTGLPFGHVPTKVLLPVGAQVSLAVDERDALLYWGHWR